MYTGILFVSLYHAANNSMNEVEYVAIVKNYLNIEHWVYYTLACSWITE